MLYLRIKVHTCRIKAVWSLSASNRSKYSHILTRKHRGRLQSYPGIIGCCSTCRSGLCQQEDQTESQSPTVRKEKLCIHKVSAPSFPEKNGLWVEKGYMYLHKKSLKSSPSHHFISHIFGIHFLIVILWVFHFTIIFNNHSTRKYYEVGFCRAGAFDKQHIALCLGPHNFPAIQKAQEERSHWKAMHCTYV